MDRPLRLFIWTIKTFSWPDFSENLIKINHIQKLSINLVRINKRASYFKPGNKAKIPHPMDINCEFR